MSVSVINDTLILKIDAMEFYLLLIKLIINLANKIYWRSGMGRKMDAKYTLRKEQNFSKAPCFTFCEKSTVRVKICFNIKRKGENV